MAAIDAANNDDPSDFGGEPLAVAHGRIAESWVERFTDKPSPALRLAARGHHLRRWELQRSSYPAGRAGYLRWRRDQKVRHADGLATILATEGVDPATISRVGVIVAKVGLGNDAEVQTFEDAVVMAFLETQLVELADRTEPARMIEVIAKTLVKMSPAGRAAAIEAVPSLGLSEAVGELVTAAVARAADSIT